MAQVIDREPRGLRRAAAVSAGLHVLVLLALVLGLPAPRLPEAPSTATIAMEFGPAAPTQRALAPGKVAAPADVPQPIPAPPAFVPPKAAPPSPAPPPPPPPPPPAPPPPSVAPAVPTPAPPVPTTPAAESLPLPPPPPPAPPAPPQKAQALPVPPSPVPPPPVPSPKVSPNTQPNKTTNPAPDSRALENTLEKLRALQQLEAPTARTNPLHGGAPHGGGTPTGSDNAALTADARAAIGAEVRACWTRDGGALDANKLSVQLQVVTDPGGVVRIVHFAPEDQAKMNADPVFRAFAERARRAVLDPQCATLPLPKSMLGKNQTLNFRFRP